MSPTCDSGRHRFLFYGGRAIRMKGNWRICIMRVILIATAIAFTSIAISGCVPIGGNPNCATNAGGSEISEDGKPRRYPVVL